ncbi:efflux RND transporter permease subunit [Acidiphilium sp.]|uniref:efflux RND transporter permease subunit n=1 Tax=Acidiphilium sp. TaxID=527 RepID=UPI003CFDAC7B
MLETIVRLSVRHRFLVVSGAVILFLLGIHSVLEARPAVFGSFLSPRVTVVTRIPGLAPRAVELEVTDRLEQGLGGISGLAATDSRSESGISVVHLVFHSKTSLSADRKAVSGRLTSLIRELPPGANPVVAPTVSTTAIATEIGLTSRILSSRDLTSIAESQLRPALQAISGVAKVTIYGAAQPEIGIAPRTSAMIATGISLSRLAHAAHDASAIVGLGTLDTSTQRILLESHGQAIQPQAISQSLLDLQGGVPITISTVARVWPTTAPRTGSSLINGQPGLLIVVSATYGTNTADVAADVARTAAHFLPALTNAGIKIVPAAFVPSRYTHDALGNLTRLLLIGGVLVLLTLIVTLRNWRVALVSFAVVPVALVASLNVLTFSGYPITTLALVGLAIALGEVIYDSIVVTTTIRDRLYEAGTPADEATFFETIVDSASEVKMPIFLATLAAVIVFVPIITLAGSAGRLFAPIALTYIAALIASLIVTLIVSPALAALLFARDKAVRRAMTPDAVRRTYAWTLRVSGPFGIILGALALIGVIAALVSLPDLKLEFIQHFDDPALVATFRATPGTSIATMDQIADRATKLIRKVDGVSTVVAAIGRPVPTFRAHLVSQGSLDITLSGQDPDTVSIERKIRDKLHALTGFGWTLNSFAAQRVHAVAHDAAAPIVIVIRGEKLGAISRDAAKIFTALHGLKDIRRLRLFPQPFRTPSVIITPNRVAMLHYDIAASSLLHIVQLHFNGNIVGHVYVGNLLVPVVLAIPRQQRTNPASLEQLLVRSADGQLVPLGLVARIKATTSRVDIFHSNGQRAEFVDVIVHGRHVSAVLAAVRSRLAKVRLESDDYLTIGGSFFSQLKARHSLFVRSFIAGLVIVGLLSIALADGWAVALLGLGLPFALAGGIAAIWIFLDGNITFSALIGLVTLFGIALRNGLLLLITYRRHITRITTIPENTADLAQDVAIEILPIILLTTTVTAFGLLPLAIATGTAGDEVGGPLAIVLIGGLLAGTILTMLFLPRLAPRVLKTR